MVFPGSPGARGSPKDDNLSNEARKQNPDRNPGHYAQTEQGFNARSRSVLLEPVEYFPYKVLVFERIG